MPKKFFLIVGLISGLVLFGAALSLAAQTAPGSANSATITTAPAATSVMPIKDCWYGANTMQMGANSEEVRQLQAALSQDKTIYPEGVTSGYYGQLTTEAVKRLQEKYGLPQTGVVDENVRTLIFPCWQIKVSYPNGGETFKVGETMKVGWELVRTDTQILKEQSLGISAPSVNSVMPSFLPLLSVDLVQQDATISSCPTIYPGKCYPETRTVFHIRNLNLKENAGSLEWLIPATIGEAKDYKISVSLHAGGSPCPAGAYCMLNFLPSWYVADESDGVFAILGGTAPASPTPLASVTAKPSPTVWPTPVANSHPYCSALGTRSEGWYDQIGLIRWDSCKDCKAVCQNAGTRSEGWYSSCDKAVIKYASCASIGSTPIPTATVLETPLLQTQGVRRWMELTTRRVGETVTSASVKLRAWFEGLLSPMRK